jgi:hypothetical protein
VDGTKIRYGIFLVEGLTVGLILLLIGHREFIEKYTEFIEDFQKEVFMFSLWITVGRGFLITHSKTVSRAITLILTV